MKNKKIFFGIALLAIILIIALIVINSLSYKNKTITASNYETVIKEAKDSNLTDEEKTQFASGILKYAFNPSGIYGKKVKDVIKEGKSLTETAEGKNNIDKSTDVRTMEEFVQKFKDNGCDIDLNKKPLFAMIDAIDGVIFDIDNDVVKIYKYSNEENYNNAKNIYSFMETFEKNGLFVLETNNERAKQIFREIN